MILNLSAAIFLNGKPHLASVRHHLIPQPQVGFKRRLRRAAVLRDMKGNQALGQLPQIEHVPEHLGDLLGRCLADRHSGDLLFPCLTKSQPVRFTPEASLCLWIGLKEGKHARRRT